jgi:hypothetical protein
MKLNREQIIKALECFHQRILNTELAEKITESEITAVLNAIALIKELTEDNEMLSNSCFGFMQRCIALENECADLSDIVENYRVELAETRVALAEANEEKRKLAEENERLHVALNTDISIVRMSRGSGKTSHLREVGRIRVDAIRANAVREMAERLEELYTDEVITDDMTVSIGVIKQNIKDITKEMLEETK